MKVWILLFCIYTTQAFGMHLRLACGTYHQHSTEILPIEPDQVATVYCLGRKLSVEDLGSSRISYKIMKITPPMAFEQNEIIFPGDTRAKIVSQDESFILIQPLSDDHEDDLTWNDALYVARSAVMTHKPSSSKISQHTEHAHENIFHAYVKYLFFLCVQAILEA